MKKVIFLVLLVASFLVSSNTFSNAILIPVNEKGNKYYKELIVLENIETLIHAFIDDQKVKYLYIEPVPMLLNKEFKKNKYERIEQYFNKKFNMKYNEYFNIKDNLFIQKQIKQSCISSWSDIEQDKVNLLSEGFNDQICFLSIGIYSISIPVFNEDLTKSLLTVKINLIDATNEFLYLMEKSIDNTWVVNGIYML